MNLNFIKVDINILNDNKINIIRKYPEGDSLLILWIGLLCMAMKSDTTGYIYITQGIPYTIDDLSNELKIEKKTVEMGLKLFKEYRMIDIIEGGIIEIINFNKHQQLDRIEHAKEISRKSSRKFREKQKQLLLSDGHVTNSDDLDKETEYKDKETEYKNTAIRILLFLNDKAERKYRPTKNTLSFIISRLKEKYTEEQCKKVIDTMCCNWKGTEWEQYLTYSTLFRPSNFEKYLNAKKKNENKEIKDNNICKKCGKKYNYSTEKNKCNDCIRKEIDEEREEIHLNIGGNNERTKNI